MNYSPKQAAILAYCREHDGTITVAQAVALVGDQYHNQHKHTCTILSNMGKRGMLAKVTRGVWTSAVTERRLARDLDVLPELREWARERGAK